MTFKSSSRRDLIPTLVVLLAAGSLTAMTGNLVTPVFPEVVEEFQVDPRWAGLLVGMHTLTIALFSPILGILADRIGKLRVLIACLIGYGVFGMAGAWTWDFQSMLTTRALLGAASGGVAAASVGYVASLFEGEERSRMLGYTTSALATTSIFFPLLGGWIGSFNWHYSFYLYVIAFPVAIAAALVLPKRKGTTSQPSQFAQFDKDLLLANLKRPAVLLMLFTLVLASGLFYIVIVYAPLHFKASIGADPTQNGMILASRAIGAAIISAVGSSRLAMRWGVPNAVGVGFMTMALMLFSIPPLTHLPLIIIAAVLFGMGYGIVMPNLYDALAALSPMALRTSILALGTGVSSLGQFLSPVVLGPLWKSAGTAVFFVGTAVGIVVAIAFFLIPPSRIAPPTEPATPVDDPV